MWLHCSDTREGKPGQLRECGLKFGLMLVLASFTTVVDLTGSDRDLVVFGVRGLQLSIVTLSVLQNNVQVSLQHKWIKNLTRSLLPSLIGNGANQVWVRPCPIAYARHCQLNNVTVQSALVRGKRDFYSVWNEA